MDFELTSEQQALADSVDRFCAREYAFDRRRELALTQLGFSRAHWSTFAQLGWLGAGLSQGQGGYGGGAAENALIADRLGRALALEPFLSCAVLAAQTLAALPSGGARDTLIERIVSGETLVALAHNENAARGDVGVVETRFRREGVGWRLTGEKRLILGAPSADVLLVSARGEDGTVGLFLIQPDAEGLTLQPYRTVDNIRAADIRLENAWAQALAEPGERAMEAIVAGHDHALVTVCAEAVGVMDAAVTLTRDYVNTRQQFGVAIGSLQAVQHRMADMLIEFELSRSVVFGGLAALEGPTMARPRVLSAMKAVVSSAAMFVGRQAIQLHGGIGMTEELAIGHHYRRLFAIATLFGTERAHIERLAKSGGEFWQDDDPEQQEAHVGGR